MARSRLIKPEFWDDEKLASVSRDARLTFVGMWKCSDDYGVTKGNPNWLKSNIFPYDNISIEQFTEWIKELEDINTIVQFKANGENYYFIRTFLKHQKIDHPSQTRNPQVPESIDQISESIDQVPESIDQTLLQTETETETETETDAKKEDIVFSFPTNNKYKLTPEYEIFEKINKDWHDGQVEWDDDYFIIIKQLRAAKGVDRIFKAKENTEKDYYFNKHKHLIKFLGLDGQNIKAKIEQLATMKPRDNPTNTGITEETKSIYKKWEDFDEPIHAP